jgi:uncharacterized membrane protein/thiol-disulfide isomerase/thioredoxin
MRLLVLLLFPFLLTGQSAGHPIVQAILFYSPFCPHCYKVINELLVPMQEQYGDQLQLIGIDTSLPAGSDLYRRAIERFDISDPRIGVPTLIIGDTVLVGGGEIPAQFPTLVAQALSAGGIGWPDIPDLAVAIPDLPPSAGPEGDLEVAVPATAEPETNSQDLAPASTPAAATSGLPTTVPSVQSLDSVGSEADARESGTPPADPMGFSLATLVLIAMVTALIYTVRLIGRPLLNPAAYQSAVYKLSWAVPILAFIGLGVALYLSYVEVAQVEAVCGPIGECNIVQSSPYARMMGFPVAVLGALSYIAIWVLWLGERFLPGRLSAVSMLSLAALTIFGTGFSIYLTALELFAIKAVCAWCLSSAVVTTLILLLVAKSISKGSRQVALAVQA